LRGTRIVRSFRFEFGHSRAAEDRDSSPTPDRLPAPAKYVLLHAADQAQELVRRIPRRPMETPEDPGPC
jgi:hypothetical protein